MLRQNEIEFQALEDEHRKDSRGEDSRQKAGEDDEQQIIAGIERRDDNNRDDQEIDHTLARKFILDFFHPPLERRPLREVRNHLDGDDARQEQRERRREHAPVVPPRLIERRRKDRQ